MSTLLQALSDGSVDLLNKKDSSSNFSKKLDIYRNIIVNEYLKYNVDLNRAIAKIAVKDNLNDDQIQRIVEEVNNQVYLIKYNQMKNSPERDVVFDIASVAKVKGVIGNDDYKKPVYNSESQPNQGGDQIAKKASWENDEGDSLNFLNYTTHEFSSLSPDIIRSKDSILAEKIASFIKEKEDSFRKITEKIACDTYDVAEALIKYDRFGIDVQNIFDTICKEADVNKQHQIMYKDAVIQKIAQMKEYRELPDDYSLELSLCESEKVANEFSLGKYSFIKEATETTQSNQNIPVITVSDKKTIRSINDLISAVKKIQADRGKALQEYKELKSIKEKTASLSMEELEKLAAGGLANFGKNLLGINKRNALKDLKSAKGALDDILKHPHIQNAKNTITTLENAAKNIEIHPRMNQVNRELNSAKDNLSNILKKHDNVLNNAATKNPISKLLDSDYRNAVREIKSAKKGVKKANIKYNAQKSRLQNEVLDEIDNAKNKYKDLSAELGLSDAEKKVQDAQRAYEKALGQTRRARMTAGVAVGAPTALYAKNKNKQSQQQDLNQQMY